MSKDTYKITYEKDKWNFHDLKETQHEALKGNRVFIGVKDGTVFPTDIFQNMTNVELCLHDCVPDDCVEFWDICQKNCHEIWIPTGPQSFYNVKTTKIDQLLRYKTELLKN